jgi:pimeloyl-ACP methyl ester carboxylesterase
MREEHALTGEAAGVPFVALPPSDRMAKPPLVVVWHMTDPPRSETAMAAALPLRAVPAWRVYLGLPMSGSRLPAGGLEEFFRLGYEDAVLKLFDPMTTQALEEFPSALAALRERLRAGNDAVGLIGASAGAFVALSVLAQTDVPVSAVALISPAIRLASVVAANERRFGVTYPWSERSRAAAERLDFVARADAIAARNAATLLLVGELDDEEGFIRPAEQLRAALARRSRSRTSLVRIPEMAHALADEPGLDPAPQTPQAARVEAVVVDWFQRHLTAPTARA